MKANLQYERLGAPYGGTSSLFFATFQIYKDHTGFDFLEGFKHHEDWVAEIVGFSAKFRYNREFLRGHADYTHANSKMSRGIIVNYVLESGKIYEVYHLTTGSRIRRYFCTVRDDGEIIELSEAEVVQCLRRRLGLTSAPRPDSE
jgi:hypothetical protein